MFHVIINNAKLNRKYRKRLTAVERVFQSHNLDYKIIKTVTEEDVDNAVRDITTGCGQTVVVMGGDGTLHRVLNSFVNFESNAMALIPSGTGNDFAEAAKIPLDAEKAAKLIAEGSPERIDFISLSSGVRSINAAGMGIDVDVLLRLKKNKTKRSSYLKALVQSFLHFKSIEFTAEYDGKSEKHFGLIGAVGNGMQFGGGIKMFPGADIKDGYMELVIADYLSKIKTLMFIPKLKKGKLDNIKQVSIVRTKAVKFITEKACALQADGEVYENMPLEAKIEEGKLLFYLGK